MSAPRACERPCWIQTVIILIGLAVLMWWAFQEKLTPDDIDCRGRGIERCWDYDSKGRPLP